MTKTCYIAVVALCLALFTGLCRLTVLECVNEAPKCTNYSGALAYNVLAPEDVTVQTGENATFTAKSRCRLIMVFVNGCPVSVDSVRLSTHGDVHTLTYTVINASLNDSGNSIDFMMFCGGLSCYHTVYLTVLDPPIEPADIIVITTCSGFNISFISSDATVVTLTSSNGTMIYNGTVEPSVNFIEINNYVMNNEVYGLRLQSYNEAGQSQYVVENITTDSSIINFEISNVSIEYVSDVPEATVTLNVNNDCMLSIPCTVDVKCGCLRSPSVNIILNRMFQVSLDLVNYKKICDLTVEAGTLQVNKSINTTAVISFTVNSTVTHDGYFYINATLQKGVAGIMIQAQYINGSVLFNQPILRNSSSDYAGANNTTPLPNGTFYLAIYMLKSDGVSFDLSRPIRENIVITSLINPDGPVGPKDKFPTWVIILIVSVTGVAALIFVVILVPAILCWCHNRRRREEIKNRQLNGGEVDTQPELVQVDGGPQEDRQAQGCQQPPEAEPSQEDEQPPKDKQSQEDGQPQKDRQPQEDGEGPTAQAYPQPVQEDPQVKGQKCMSGHESNKFLSISKQSYPVLTKPSLPPHSPSAFEQTKTFENLSSDARVYESASINITIREDNSVSYSSTAGSDRPLLPEPAPTTSYQTTAAEEKKVNKPQKVRADSEPFEIVHI
ncbi:PREDICTED: uncharacterized protein LOC109585234 [Amphimedon queenslandica]|uniref:Uncharacterized protein n=1 Tax=Amphimedon queenslandica TaxID=400682 RepID=A0A1X7U0P9_AMPQE|nr:PREDICTED: uncharacterized protein LOC109585234 [Amphimedon queenslandica]|eukprot:XP_019856786.1 PREDICTED: uncharacterized protein LOC109585234 [Amphimedon queenslandica]